MTPLRSSTRRRNRLVAFIAVATGLALLALVVWWANPNPAPTADISNPPIKRSTPSAVPTQAAGPSPEETPAVQEPAGTMSDIASRLPSAVDLPGLSGEGMSADVPPLTLTITVTSTAPIGTVGWVIPMSKEKSSGQVGGVGRSWSLSTTVYGKPDYARVFLQAGPTGDSVTCVITVNGAVTERRSTVGPYGALMCQG